ncbi:MAG TPA: taurine catabolism dioxygenase TauD [Gammaproteobacteria bacterium]|nr:taurine catabolism dioxygenase TauD [Gammaproteobacteria bacterium]
MSAVQTDNPFDLDSDAAYQRWREEKLRRHPERIDDLIVEIRDLRKLSKAEHSAVVDRIRRCNMAIYTSRHDSKGNENEDKALVRALGRQFGLERLDHNMGADEDAITSLTVQDDALHRGYIPYTNRAIAWHTDGYYNSPERQIHALLLHCASPAREGGENRLLDHEMVYLQLRDRNPAWITALMHPEAMTIPANIVEGKTLRPAVAGPVFSVTPDGRLHMRYTDRNRSIQWRNDPLTFEAVAALKATLRSGSPWHFAATLQAGQGLISNNVLHTRSGFTDGDVPRLLYRARYYNGIAVHSG